MEAGRAQARLFRGQEYHFRRGVAVNGRQKSTPAIVRRENSDLLTEKYVGSIAPDDPRLTPFKLFPRCGAALKINSAARDWCAGTPEHRLD